MARKPTPKFFELLLRLRANTCWPAMHPISKPFNYFARNKVVADDYAIVMSASHAEPMLYNNASEWKKSVNGEWNYLTSAAGMNKVWGRQTEGKWPI